LGRYRPERAPFAGWLFAVARNAVNDHLRAQRRRRWLSLEALRGRASPEPPLEAAVIDDETRADLLTAVARLSGRERDLIALKFAAGLTNRRIAQLTGLSESNVGVILYRTVRRLRAKLSSEENDR
jgi:RNA polymerase sigma-70 factor (ECF subfamily)